MGKNKSLDKWLFGFITMGTAIMCLVITLAGMAMYMRSVRRIYHAEMIQNATAASDLIGDDLLAEMCVQYKKGAELDENKLNDISTIFRKICEEESISDMALFTFDNRSYVGYLVVSAYPETEIKNEKITLTDTQISLIRNLTAGMQVSRKPGERWKNYAYYAIKNDSKVVVGLIRVTMPASETLNARLRYFLIYTPFCAILIIIFAVIASRAITKRIVVPLSKLNKSAVEYSSHEAGELAETEEVYFAPPDNLNNDEIGSLWNTCSNMEKSLNESIRNLQKATAEEERQAAEVGVASQIQLGMLPKPSPEILSRNEFAISGSMTPAKGVGGDFYDYFMIDSNHLALVVGDVSGKGIPAALFMMMSMTQIRTQSLGRRSPAEIIKAANETICRSNPEMMFVTVWLGIVEISTGKMIECNAGHEDVVICMGTEGYRVHMTDRDLPLGIMEDTQYTDREMILNRGDRVFVYTDGVPEAINTSDEQFGMDRLIVALNKNPGMKDDELTEFIKNEVFAFAGEEAQFDDITMLSFTLT
ncbi:MAG: PP2C family protein-serine/threonine phosphatase [Butyrivibrio sp.]|nr:PP2C family protein-serine/threonine phosphatase [Butyrivibrio sp.]